jgi:hypothetical protein
MPIFSGNIVAFRKNAKWHSVLATENSANKHTCHFKLS